MGLSSSKTTSSTTPVYGPQLQGAADTLSSAYNQQAPKIAHYADELGSIGTDLLDKYRAGNPMIKAASRYVTNTLNGNGSNPELQAMIDQTNNDVMNQTEGALGVRGQTGGSGYADLISRNLAKNETGLRYQDYTTQLDNKARAAGLAPGIAAGDYLTLAPALSSLSAASELPMDAATKFAAGTGGLLGQYTSTTQKQSGGLLGQILGTALAAAPMFF